MLCQFLLYSKVIQLHTYIYILFHILFHYRLLQGIEYSSLCYRVGPCLSIFYIYSSVYLLEIYTIFIYEGVAKKVVKKQCVVSLKSTFNWASCMLLGISVSAPMVPMAAGALASSSWRSLPHQGSLSPPLAQSLPSPAARIGWGVGLRPCPACSSSVFASWSAVTLLPCPLGFACRETPNIVENFIQCLWASGVAHLDMGQWGGNFELPEATGPPSTSCVWFQMFNYGLVFPRAPELHWCRSELAAPCILIFNISNILPAGASMTAVCFKSTN